MSINIVPTRVVKTHWDMVQQSAEEAGRTPDRSEWRVAREVYISDTSKQARKEALEGVMTRDFQNYFLRTLPRMRMLGLMKQDPNMPDSDVTPEYIVDNIWVVGSADEVAEKLSDMNEAVGGFGVLLAMGHEWEPRERWLNSMAVLAEEVVPKL